MNNSIFFFVGIVAGGLLSVSCHYLDKKSAERTEVSKKDVVSSPASQSRKIPAFQFRRIEKGSFTMGSPDKEKKRLRKEALKLVEISKSFEIMTKEVTQRQWFEVMRKNPSYFKLKEDCRDHEIVEGVKMCPNHPVESVSWYKVQKYIKKLNASLGLKACNGRPDDTRGCYRLPTEAEWEYAVRAGTKTAYFFGNDSSVLGDYAWYKENSERRTHKTGMKAPNQLGLHDVYGNVYEWVQDGHKRELPGGKDPLVPIKSSCPDTILRGGSWASFAQYLRSAFRFHDGPDHGYFNVGFRLVRTL